MQSLVMGMVVKITNILKKTVQMGSTIVHPGLKKMTIAAKITPTDYTVSPTRWIMAALMFMFSCE